MRNETLQAQIIINGQQARKEIADLNVAIDKEQASVKKLNSEMRTLEKLHQKDSQLYREKKAAVDASNESIKQAKSRIKEIRDAMHVQSLTMSELKQRIRETSAQLNKLDPNTKQWQEMSLRLSEANTRLTQLKNSTKETSGILTRLWNSATGAVAIIGVAFGAVLRLAKGIMQATEKMADFEQANVNLATILGKNVKDIGNLTDSALQLGRTTEYTASQVTSLQTELAKLGFSEDQILAMEEPVLHFATAVGTDLASAAKLAGATLRIFGLRASDTEDVLSTLTVGTNKSALSFTYLETAMSIAGPVARTFGFSVKDTTALLGTLANAGFDASSAATATRNIILNLANANGKLAKALGEPVKTFPELMDALKKLDEQGVDLATTLELTDKRSVSAFNSFLRGADDALTLRDSLEDVGGELERIADERMNTLEGSIKLLTSAWEGFILSMRNSVGPIKWIVDRVTDLVNGLNDHIDPEGAAQRKANERINHWLEQMVKLDQGDIERFKSDAYAIYQTAADAYTNALEAYKNKRNRANRKALDEAMLERQAAWTAYERALDSASSPVPVVVPDPDGEKPDGGGSGGDKKTHKASWSLSSDETYLAAKAELTRQYNEGEIASQQEYNERLYQLEISTYKARLASGKDFGADRAKIENDMQNAVMKHNADLRKSREQQAADMKKHADAAAELIASAETDATKKALAAEEKRYQAELKQWEGYDHVQEAIEKKHQVNLGKIELQGLLERMDIRTSEHTAARAAIEASFQEILNDTGRSARERMNAQEELNKSLLEEDKSYLEDVLAIQKQILDSKDDWGITEKDAATLMARYEELKKQLEQAKGKLENADLSATTYSSAGKSSLFGINQSDWDLFFHNIKKGKLSIDDFAFAFHALGGVASEGLKVATAAIDLTNAKEEKALQEYRKSQDAKKEALKQRFDKGQMDQAQYDAEVKRMESEQEAYEAELALKKAKREKALSLAQVAINTATAIMKIWAEVPKADFGVATGILTAMASAAGVAQAALIAATPVTGKEEGGPIGEEIVVQRQQDGKRYRARYEPGKRGFVRRPTVLAGESGTEYVIPAEGLANPSLLPFIHTIETARRHGTLRNLNLAAVYPSAAIPGRASGGFVSSADAPVASALSGTNITIRDPELLAVLQKLSIQLDRPIEAVVSLLGPKGLIKALADYDRSKSRGSVG